jgi:hypothetical protein
MFLLLLFVPFYLPVGWGGMGSSLNLYFQRFEFNASLYYLLRQLGFWLSGYNQIALLGPLLALLPAALAAYLLLKRWGSSKLQSLVPQLLLLWAVYLLCATTVHPWYIGTLVLLSSLCRSRFTLVWSVSSWLSYTAYTTVGVAEHPLLLVLEYAPVYTLFFWEMKKEQPLRAALRLST